MTEAHFECFSGALREIGAEVDAYTMSTGRPGRPTCSIAHIRTRSGIMPSLPMLLEGLVAIYKPTDWEVDGLVGDGQPPPLSAYMQSIFREDECPLVWDA